MVYPRGESWQAVYSICVPCAAHPQNKHEAGLYPYTMWFTRLGSNCTAYAHTRICNNTDRTRAQNATLRSPVDFTSANERHRVGLGIYQAYMKALPLKVNILYARVQYKLSGTTILSSLLSYRFFCLLYVTAYSACLSPCYIPFRRQMFCDRWIFRRRPNGQLQSLSSSAGSYQPHSRGCHWPDTLMISS